jgi:hypothetical protein
MWKSRFLSFILPIILLFAIEWVLSVKPSTSAYGACRNRMLQVEGVGPWKHQSTRLVPPRVVLDFDDGENIATCVAQQIGPIWYVTGLYKTLVCSLPDCSSSESKFGVIP